MAKRIDWKDVTFFDEVTHALQQGNVVAGGSDTVLGLLAAVTPAGKKRLDQIKRRSEIPYVILVANLQKAEELSPFFKTEKGRQLAKAFWPGPLTLIVPAAKGVPRYLQSKTGGIAIRVPDHAVLQRLLAQMGMLFSTSANLSGNPIPEHISEIDPSIAAQISYLVGDSDGKTIASTILDCTQKEPQIVRHGAVSDDFLKRYL